MFQFRPYHSTGTLPSGAGAVAAALRARASEWGAELEEKPDCLTLHVWGCTLSLIADGGTARLELAATEKRLIGVLQDSAVTLLEAVGLEIRWDHVDTGALAPGLALMRVVDVAQRTPGFIRVRLTGDEAGRFAQGGLHFRLLLPPAGRRPVWPRIAANGRTAWPEGADAPHRAVYTVAAQDQDWLDFDIYRHANSPTCDWADGVRVGDQVGIIGPGGGSCPPASQLWLFGDETALPAIARMLAQTQGHACAHIRASAADLAELADDARVARCDDLLTALDHAAQGRADFGTAPDHHVWFAGPADHAREARRRLLARGVPKRNFTAAAYWG